MRGHAIGATAIQIFTKTPNQWREPKLLPETSAAFREAIDQAGLAVAISHDSYLINLASPDPDLTARSITAFTAELERSTALGLAGVVSHPGNYLDERARGIERNARAYTECLRAVPGPTEVYLETTAGTGTALGRTFEELKELRDQIGDDVRHRVGICADTCHLYSAGYDLVHHYDDVWEQFDRILGFELLRCLHLNDSKTPYHSHRDRHELIGEGTLGPTPFQRIMTDPRLAAVTKIIETPKGDDPVASDRRMLLRLCEYAQPD